MPSRKRKSRAEGVNALDKLRKKPGKHAKRWGRPWQGRTIKIPSSKQINWNERMLVAVRQKETAARFLQENKMGALLCPPQYTKPINLPRMLPAGGVMEKVVLWDNSTRLCYRHPNCYSNPKVSCDYAECEACHFESFASHPEVAAYFNTANLVDGVLPNPRSWKHGSSDYLTKQCLDCHHVLHKQRIARWTECGVCFNKRRCSDTECKHCHEHSLWPLLQRLKEQGFDCVEEEIDPRQISTQSSQPLRFQCRCCKFIFLRSPGNWVNCVDTCPHCTGNQICKIVDCKVCDSHRMSSHPFAAQWSEKNEVSPIEVFKHTDVKYWFDCDVCPHDFEIALSNLTKQEHERRCGYCHGDALCLDQSCTFCHDKSFASAEQAQFWHPTLNEGLLPRDVCRNSGKKHWFLCPDCTHPWQAWLYNVSRSPGTACPRCRNKTEALILDFLEQQRPEEKWEHQAEFDWCKSSTTNHYYPFDFASEPLECISECDGGHHFRPTFKGKTPEQQRKQDVLKMKRALAQGYSVIRISQEDVWNNRFDWKSLLAETIAQVKRSTEPTVYYLSTDPHLYDAHRALML